MGNIYSKSFSSIVWGIQIESTRLALQKVQHSLQKYKQTLLNDIHLLLLTLLLLKTMAEPIFGSLRNGCDVRGGCEALWDSWLGGISSVILTVTSSDYVSFWKENNPFFCFTDITSGQEPLWLENLYGNNLVLSYPMMGNPLSTIGKSLIMKGIPLTVGFPCAPSAAVV